MNQLVVRLRRLDWLDKTISRLGINYFVKVNNDNFSTPIIVAILGGFFSMVFGSDHGLLWLDFSGFHSFKRKIRIIWVRASCLQRKSKRSYRACSLASQFLHDFSLMSFGGSGRSQAVARLATLPRNATLSRHWNRNQMYITTSHFTNEDHLT